ncbi:hypothetical protein GGS26DRAFT_501711 [Hypomontagnella submonticulosa]|nr:hypothetical protein GGS26DRAFT_501711 [Hypomontagnella submonticulosa]
MGVTFESIEYQCSVTRPDIPYTLYVGEDHLLLVPREVAKVHPKFPSTQDPLPRLKLQLSQFWIDEYKSTYGSDPEFTARRVGFGLEEDEVVVAAVLAGTPYVPNWQFSNLLKGDTRNAMDESSDAYADFGMMQFDLSQAAEP